MTVFILHVATSLDGYIARSDGSIDWLPDPEAAIDNSGYGQFYDSIDALIMGSTTYEQVLSFGDWPYAGKPAYVLTHQTRSTPRRDVIFMQGVEEAIDAVNHKGYGRVWLVGGGKLASAFIQRGVVDEYLIAIIPVLLGSGISLYQFIPEVKLRLNQSKAYPSGIVELHYQKA